MLKSVASLIAREKWLLAGLVIGAICLEGVIRLVAPGLAGQVYSGNITGGHPIVLSDTSLRVAARPYTRPDSLTVLGLGDSTTFGTGVSAEETWPLQLDALLGPDRSAENAGIPGNEPRQLAYGFDQIWSKPTPPQAVVILVTGNMISFANFRRGDAIKDPRERVDRINGRARDKSVKRRVVEAVQSSALWKSISIGVDYTKFAVGLVGHRTNPERPLSPMIPYGWQQADLPEGQFEEMWADFEEGMTSLRDHATDRGSCLVVGFLPPRFEIGDGRLDNLKFVPKHRLTYDPEGHVERLARKLGVRYAPVAEALRQTRANHSPLSMPLYVPGDYTHLSAGGHGVVAQTLADFITPILDGAEPCEPK